MEQQFRFRLEPYSANRKYGRCPRCGKLRYINYIDIETRARLPDEYGRCERINNCGYHKFPNEFINKLKKKEMNTINKKEQISEIFEERVMNNTMLVGEEEYPSGALIHYLSCYIEKSILYKVLKEYRIMVSKVSFEK